MISIAEFVSIPEIVAINNCYWRQIMTVSDQNL